MVNQDWIEGYLDGIKKIAETIDREAIDRAVEMLWGAWQRGNTIFTCGNGGSAGTTSHPPAGPCKWTIFPHQLPLRAVSLVGNISFLSALANDRGWGKLYVGAVKSPFPT